MTMHSRYLRSVVSCAAAAIIAGFLTVLALTSAAAADPPVNDDFADAIELTGLPTSSPVTSLVEATAQIPAGEPSCLDPTTPYYGVWYEWTAPTSGAIKLTGGYYGTVEVFASAVANPALSDLSRASDISGCGYIETELSVTAGTTYWIRLSSYNAVDPSVLPADRELTIEPVARVPFADHRVPQTIEAEDFDYGAEREAYLEVDDPGENGTNVGSGAAYRASEVDIFETVGSNQPGYTIGHTRDGEFLEYTVSIPLQQHYEVVAEVATGLNNPGSLRLDINGVEIATVPVDNTGGWWQFQDVSFGTHQLEPDRTSREKYEVIRITWLANETGQLPKINFDRLRFVQPEPTECLSFDLGIRFEAEAGRRSGDLVAVADPSASGDFVLAADDGLRNRYVLGPTDYVDYCVTAEVAGTYQMSTYIYAPDNRSDSIWMQIDDQEPMLWHIGAEAPRQGRAYTQVIDSRTLDEWRFHLDEGDHRIRFYHREAGVEIDSFALRPKLAAAPAAPAPASCSFNIGIDAEWGDISGQMNVDHDVNASGGKYLALDSSVGVNYANPSTANFATYCVNIPEAGNYKFVADSITPDTRSDSLMLSIGTSGIDTWHMPNSTTWTTQTKPGSYALPAGETTVVIYGREPGTLVDQFSLIPE